MYNTFWYNNECRLSIENVIQYDIERCIPTILKYYNMVDLLSLSKQESLICVGNLFKNNKQFYDFIQSIISLSIHNFIINNSLEKNNIINILKDGLLIDKRVANTKYDFPFIPSERCVYKLYLSYGTNRKKYFLCKNEKEFEIKGFGISYPIGLMKWFNSVIMEYYNSNDLKYKNKKLQIKIDRFRKNKLNDFSVADFMIPKGNSFLFYMKSEIITTKNYEYLNLSDIDFETYFQIFIQPFLISLTF